jgi:hypothetical protein
MQDTVAVQSRPRSLAIDLAWIALFSSVFALVKAVGREGGLHLPGHSAAFWLPVLFLAGATVKRRGSVCATAGLGAFLSTVPHPPSVGWLLGYGIAALVLEAGLKRADKASFLHWTLLGGVANLGKFVAKCAFPGTGSAFGFLRAGLTASATSHLLFGMAGGAIAAALWYALASRRRPGE